MKKTIFLLIICTILTLSFRFQAFGAPTDNNIITPSWTNLTSVSSYLSIDSYGVATCTGRITQRLSDGSCELVMKLQKLSSTNSWSTIATWTTEGTTSCYKDTYKSVTKGTYRVSVTGKVYDSVGNLIESSTVYSSIKTY